MKDATNHQPTPVFSLNSDHPVGSELLPLFFPTPPPFPLPSLGIALSQLQENALFQKQWDEKRPQQLGRVYDSHQPIIKFPIRHPSNWFLIRKLPFPRWMLLSVSFLPISELFRLKGKPSPALIKLGNKSISTPQRHKFTLRRRSSLCKSTETSLYKTSISEE